MSEREGVKEKAAFRHPFSLRYHIPRVHPEKVDVIQEYQDKLVKLREDQKMRAKVGPDHTYLNSSAFIIIFSRFNVYYALTLPPEPATCRGTTPRCMTTTKTLPTREKSILLVLMEPFAPCVVNTLSTGTLRSSI